MSIKKVIFTTALLFSAIVLGNSPSVGASDIDDDSIIEGQELPDGVELYYPKDPEALAEEHYADMKLEELLTPYRIDDYLSRAYLYQHRETDSTKRLYLSRGDRLRYNWNVWKFGPRGTIVSTIFKDGKYYQSYAIYKKGFDNGTLTPFNDSSGWSMRLYCGNPDERELGCDAEGEIFNPDY